MRQSTLYQHLRSAAAVGLAGALGITLALALPSGCGSSCGDFVDCPSRAGLRYVRCGGDRYEFNDGATKSTEKDAIDYCYCNLVPIECTNGDDATMCNTGTLDGDPQVWVGSDDGEDLEEGVADCLGYSGCRITSTGCTFLGWYLECEDAGEQRYVGADGTVYSSSSSVIATCDVEPGAGDSLDLDPSGSGFCNEAIDSCALLSSCVASEACWSEALDECRDTPFCGTYGDESSCEGDLACRWE